MYYPHTTRGRRERHPRFSRLSRFGIGRTDPPSNIANGTRLFSCFQQNWCPPVFRGVGALAPTFARPWVNKALAPEVCRIRFTKHGQGKWTATVPTYRSSKSENVARSWRSPCVKGEAYEQHAETRRRTGKPENAQRATLCPRGNAPFGHAALSTAAIPPRLAFALRSAARIPAAGLRKSTRQCLPNRNRHNHPPVSYLRFSTRQSFGASRVTIHQPEIAPLSFETRPRGVDSEPEIRHG